MTVGTAHSLLLSSIIFASIAVPSSIPTFNYNKEYSESLANVRETMMSHLGVSFIISWPLTVGLWRFNVAVNNVTSLTSNTHTHTHTDRLITGRRHARRDWSVLESVQCIRSTCIIDSLPVPSAAAATQCTRVYSVGQKKSPPAVFEIFSQTVGNF